MNHFGFVLCYVMLCNRHLFNSQKITMEYGARRLIAGFHKNTKRQIDEIKKVMENIQTQIAACINVQCAPCTVYHWALNMQVVWRKHI